MKTKPEKNIFNDFKIEPVTTQTHNDENCQRLNRTTKADVKQSTQIKHNFGKTTALINVNQNHGTRRQPNKDHPAWHKPLSRANLPLVQSRNIRDLHKEIEKTPARKLKKKSNVSPLTLLDIAFVWFAHSGDYGRDTFEHKKS